MAAPGAPAVPPQVARRAVEWWVDRQAGRTGEAFDAALARWRAEDPAHDAAWRHIETMQQRLGGLTAGLDPQAARAALLSPRASRRRAAVKALAVLLFAGGAAWMAEPARRAAIWPADLRTAVGERRTVTLADRTVVVLDTDTALDVRFDAAARRLRLLRGTIMVTSGHDDRVPARPLVVATAQGELRPLGTRFAVRQRDGATRIEVFAGAVRVQPDDAAARARVIAAGEGADFTRDAIGVQAPLDAYASAWTGGMLVASRMRLADLVAELDRYRRGSLRCDAAVADLRVSGTYPLDDPARVLDTLKATLPIDVHYLTRYWATVVPARS
ncbi:TPA: FecR domain-containing protein [Burkholderia cepacia ATCC 25416]|uniref:FecR domain-containing protein n=1 Tax=Burkholderia cepacia TaxID=292 RepID=UPI001CF46DBB|nr:FecR domain-containing protein [Burkholderia cepacia]HDR9769917.1 FecR domain-containing protein [Burkholderia cepacia ATCC 25416]MCA8075582.1 FecR domain-containing protein [Burkholderia cepacia]HDR9776738.1 FecR domain-containing protein [Burkholderia cepacia ATCC 25416]HDR9785097.1 FecR domain-containing protein [Burkholderia cepacia ATCC 25416]HDR9793738.1 FecR domain-containing protein [Burkholderia cepacia ATCC 25416]